MSREALISKLLADLYDRQRPAASSKNKVLTKYQVASETVTLVETFTATIKTPPFQLGASANTLVIGQGQLR